MDGIVVSAGKSQIYDLIMNRHHPSKPLEIPEIPNKSS